MAKKKRGGKGGRSVREIIERDAMRDVFALLHYSGQIAAGGPSSKSAPVARLNLTMPFPSLPSFKRG